MPTTTGDPVWGAVWTTTAPTNEDIGETTDWFNPRENVRDELNEQNGVFYYARGTWKEAEPEKPQNYGEDD